jgi:hypothetical protein
VTGRVRFNPFEGSQTEEIADSSRTNAALIQATNHIKESFLLGSPSGQMKVGKIAQRNKLFLAGLGFGGRGKNAPMQRV